MTRLGCSIFQCPIVVQGIVWISIDYKGIFGALSNEGLSGKTLAKCFSGQYITNFSALEVFTCLVEGYI